jgi:hypothetical protein
MRGAMNAVGWNCHDYMNNYKTEHELNNKRKAVRNLPGTQDSIPRIPFNISLLFLISTVNKQE